MNLVFIFGIIFVGKLKNILLLKFANFKFGKYSANKDAADKNKAIYGLSFRQVNVTNEKKIKTKKDGQNNKYKRLTIVENKKTSFPMAPV